MAFDFKKECKELYKPASKPSIVTVPPMSYVAVRGKGDPNTEGGEYQNALPLLYGIAYTVKMSKKGSRSIKGYFDFVVPPLEGFWWQESLERRHRLCTQGQFQLYLVHPPTRFRHPR